uniref:Down syndrome cell adhesion molecule-like protein Dscam2 n=1 Tax=Globodera pallida TaxID=36090 RepID=A0A183BL27_GLOPA
MVQSTASSPLSTTSSASTDSIPSDLAATFPLQTRPFLTEPNEEPYLVREGEQGPELNCSVSKQYRDRSRYELEWTKIVGETPILVSRNERLFASSGADGYALTDTLAQNGEYHLRLKGIQFARDNGRFFCALIDTETRQQMLSEPAHVVVLVPPQAPLIAAQPTEAAREGEFVTVRCESRDGNPLPRFQWLFDNRTRVPDTWFHERHEGSGTKTRAISTLQWHLTRSDNGAYLTCQVWNKALREGEFISAETNRLNVLYAPRASGLISNVPLTRIRLPQTLRGRISPSGEVHSEREWRVHVRRAHAGEFRCTATNSLDSGSDRIRLNVLYGPTVHIRTANGGGASGGSVVSPVEGERLVIDCEADANPKADAIAWTGPGGFQRNGSRLVIESVNRAHAGNFTCTAWNTLTLSSFASKSSVSVPQSAVVIRAGFDRVLVDVRRRPGPASISAKQTSLNVGEPITLGCGTDGDAGSPPARFRWAGPPTKGMYERTATEWNRAQLKLSDAQLAHNGVYRCVAFNELGQGEEASIRVTVVEPARISRPPMPTKILSNGATDVSIECEARGFPRPTVRWLRDDVQLPTDSFGHWTLTEKPSDPFPDCRPEESCVHAVLSTLRFAHPVGWADKGNYTCEAQNSPTAQRTSGTSVLTVIHQPIALNERFAEGMALAAAEPGTSTRIVCRISARPEPKVTWSRDGQEIGADFGGGEYKRHLSKARDAVDEFESVLELREVSERHFGVFTCEARNGVGEKASVDIRLQMPSRPQTPLQARLLQSGLTWLMVGWRPAFDGGERQNFELEYRMVNPYSGKAGGDGQQTDTFVFTPHNWTTMTFYGIDGDREFSARPDTYLVHNLTQLRPQSTFWYRVRARNSRGMSDWTAIANGETADARESMDIQAPEQAMYLADEQKLVVQPLRYSLSHCLLVYLSSEEDGLWRSLGCFPLAESDGIVHGILPAERFKVRYCMLNDLTKCSSGLKIFDQTYLLSPVCLGSLSFCSVSVLSLFILITLLCCRRRFQQKINAAVRRSATANGIMRPTKKKLNLNGGVVVDRIDIASPIASGGNGKNTAPNGSQTDSGVFTLGSNSATAAANAIAANGLVGGKTTGILLGAMCDEGPNFSPSVDGEWTNGAVAASLPHQQQQQLEPYDFSNDPFLQEFAAANALGGIVVVENALHQSSSTESSPSIGHQPGQQGKPPNPYSKFFNGFPSSLLGTGERGAANGSRAPPIAGGGEGGAGNSSNEQLIGAGSDSSASDSSSFRNGGGGVRVMREIIV